LESSTGKVSSSIGNTFEYNRLSTKQLAESLPVPLNINALIEVFVNNGPLEKSSPISWPFIQKSKVCGLTEYSVVFLLYVAILFELFPYSSISYIFDCFIGDGDIVVHDSPFKYEVIRFCFS